MRWQERALDALILLAPIPQAPPVTVIDIPRTDDHGNPWSRGASGRLAARLARLNPAVVGWDMVFAGGCGPETANLALAAALARAPTVLGFLLAARPEPLPGPPPALALAEDSAAGLWAAPGAEGPCAAFVARGVTLASLSLPGDSEARVRRVPAAVTVDGRGYPSLPVELARRRLGLPAPLIAGDAAPVLRLGERLIPLDRAGTLRLRPRPALARDLRTLDARVFLGTELSDTTLALALLDRVVIVGSSVPQRGGLRPTAADPLYPSVQIAADLTADLLAGTLPWRPIHAPLAEAAAVAAAGVALALLLPALAPLWGLAAAFLLATASGGAAIGAHLADHRLYDPVLPALAILLAASAALLLQAALTARAERALRQRLGQQLPPVVVSRLAARPGLLRLAGERREITALFTDLEGFTAATRALEPEDLIATLDRYFAVVSAAVLRHGGMIDKIVGDAVHALFNAPLDLPGHADAALAAAADIVAETESLRAALGIGRTRVGIETGEAILGDVGSGARIDYTAHGPCVNLAARLEQAGKALGPAIVVGPGTAARASRRLRPLGPHEVRGFGTIEVFTLA
ncbi:MAG: adenylate/guanylate cyclase domain-containing protein [Rhodobacteraceae bacterium]|nr:adenylate/guanylate cyclase domain-containing protein [Paracoccaceae bacterium]